MTIKYYNSVTEIINRYDGYLLDLWGVIHDGAETYDGVKNCLERMKEAGKKIVFVSNAPRRISLVVEKLEELNITSNLYDAVICSGEITHEFIKTSGHILGKNYYVIGPKKDMGIIADLDHKRCYTIKEADFVITTGFEHDDAVLEDEQDKIQESLSLNLPLICANPDKIVVRKNQKIALCAGVIADEYRRLGGKVMEFGKPYKEIYGAALALINITDTSKIAAIGDSLETDIKGANDIGLDSFLVPGGILFSDLDITHGQMPEPAKLDSLCKQKNIHPNFAIPALIW